MLREEFDRLACSPRLRKARVQAGDAFAGALEAEDAIFALPSLPFLVTSIADARRLADLAIDEIERFIAACAAASWLSIKSRWNGCASVAEGNGV